MSDVSAGALRSYEAAKPRRISVAEASRMSETTPETRRKHRKALATGAAEEQDDKSANTPACMTTQDHAGCDSL